MEKKLVDVVGIGIRNIEFSSRTIWNAYFP